MKRIVSFVLLSLLTVIMAACNATGNPNNKSTDPEAAQNVQPNISGYNVTSVETVTDALSKLGVGAGALSGNGALVALVTRAEATLQCFQDKGAVDAKAYSQINPSDPLNPQAGISLVINQDRVTEEALGCISGRGQRTTIQAQTVVPCVSTGQFTYRQNNYTYVYVGLGDQLCGYFQTHFDNMAAG